MILTKLNIKGIQLINKNLIILLLSLSFTLSFFGGGVNG